MEFHGRIGTEILIAKSLTRALIQRNFTLNGKDFSDHITHRYRTASSLYHMFGVLCDLIVILRDSSSSRSSSSQPTPVVYYYDVLTTEAEAFVAKRHTWRDERDVDGRFYEYITLTFEYMPEVDGRFVWDDNIASDDPSKPHNHQTIHPTLQYWNTGARTVYRSLEAWSKGVTTPRATIELHLLEDVELTFNDPVLHVKPLTTFLDRVRNGPIMTPDDEYDTSWLGSKTRPNPFWRESLSEECMHRQAERCKALY